MSTIKICFLNILTAIQEKVTSFYLVSHMISGESIHTETMSAMQRFKLPLSSLMVIGRSSLIRSIARGQSSWTTETFLK